MRGFVPRHAWDAVIETRGKKGYLRRVSPSARKVKFTNDNENISTVLKAIMVSLEENGVPLFQLDAVSDLAIEKLHHELQWKVSKVPQCIYSVDNDCQTMSVVDTLKEDEFADAQTELYNVLHPYQREGIAFALSRYENNYRGCGIFDEMGLGKTIQALGVMKYLMGTRDAGQKVHTLIICPGYLRGNWKSEIVKWSVFPETDIQIMTKLSDRPSYVNDCTLVLASYRWMRENLEHLTSTTLCIFDEAHLLKNAHHTRDSDCSLRYLAARDVVKLVKFTLFLTGTPCPNCPKELYSLLFLIGAVPTTMKYAEFAFRYCKRYFSQLFFGWHDDGVSAKNELKLLQKRHFIRRLAKDHLVGLPVEMRSFVTLPLKGGKAKLNKLAKERESLLDKLNDPSLADSKRESISKKVQFNRTKQLIASAEAKNYSFKQYFTQYLLDNPHHGDNYGKPFIVFAYHEKTLQSLHAMFENMGVHSKLVYGKTPKEHASEIIEEFQRGELKVLILSLALSSGLNLQVCSTAFFAEVTWSPGVLAQAEKRIHRQGSSHDRVHYIYLFGESPAICEEVYKKCTTKKRNVDCAVQSQEYGCEHNIKRIKTSTQK